MMIMKEKKKAETPVHSGATLSTTVDAIDSSLIRLRCQHFFLASREPQMKHFCRSSTVFIAIISFMRNRKKRKMHSLSDIMQGK